MHAMIEIERRPETMLDPSCDCARLTFLGVAIGQLATAIPRPRIGEVTLSPLLKSIMVAAGRAAEYGGFDQDPVGLEQAIASVVYGSGVLHTDADASFTIHDARVAKISLYGRWLDAFEHMSSLAKVHEGFGVPDRCLRVEAEGDVLGFDSYYAASQKWVRWLEAIARPSAVIFGAGVDAVREGERGGIARRFTHTRN